MKNKGNIVAIFVIIITLFLVGGLVLMNKLSKNTPRDIIQEPTGQKITQPSNPQQAILSRYVDYSQAAFDQAADKKRVLYFHADWCPECHLLNKEFIEKADQIPEDVVIFKTNYDTETELKKKYAITYQHTFVQVDESGNEVVKWSGGDFSEVISRIL